VVGAELLRGAAPPASAEDLAMASSRALDPSTICVAVVSPNPEEAADRMNALPWPAAAPMDLSALRGLCPREDLEERLAGAEPSGAVVVALGILPEAPPPAVIPALSLLFDLTAHRDGLLERRVCARMAEIREAGTVLDAGAERVAFILYTLVPEGSAARARALLDSLIEHAFRGDFTDLDWARSVAVQRQADAARRGDAARLSRDLSRAVLSSLDASLVLSPSPPARDRWLAELAPSWRAPRRRSICLPWRPPPPTWSRHA
jgi:hypothetical protein